MISERKCLGIKKKPFYPFVRSLRPGSWQQRWRCRPFSTRGPASWRPSSRGTSSWEIRTCAGARRWARSIGQASWSWSTPCRCTKRIRRWSVRKARQTKAEKRNISKLARTREVINLPVLDMTTSSHYFYRVEGRAKLSWFQFGLSMEMCNCPWGFAAGIPVKKKPEVLDSVQRSNLDQFHRFKLKKK